MKRSSTRLISFLLTLAMLTTFLPVSAASVPDEGLSAGPLEYENVQPPPEVEDTILPPEEDAGLRLEDEGYAESSQNDSAAPEDSEADMLPANGISSLTTESTYNTAALTIPGYTQVTEMPADGLERAYYLVIAPYNNDYYMLYPGATGAALNANNAAKLVIDTDSTVTGYRTKANGFDSETVSTDFTEADNLIAHTGSTYSVTASNGHVLICGNGQTVYQASGTSSLSISGKENARFNLINPNNSNANLIFYSPNMNFNQGSNPQNNPTTYFPDMMLFKSDREVPPEPEPPEIPALELPGFTQLTDISQLNEDKSHLIVSQAADGTIYALYPSIAGEQLGAGDLAKLGGDNDGARTALLTVNGDTVTADYLKDGTPLAIDKLYFGIKPVNGKYVFTAANGRRLNMQNYMFTEGTIELVVASRGNNAFSITTSDYNGNGTGRILDFTKNGDPNAFSTTHGTDFWCPRTPKMNIYLFESAEDFPTAKLTLEKLKDEITNAGLNASDYTKSSWAVLQSALDTANAALNSGNADDNAQVYVDARDTLQNAYDSLQPVPVPPSVPSGATKREWRDMVPTPGTTQNQPFATGTAGSDHFRIPAMITLQHQSDANKNGRLVAAIDARWNHPMDACSLDTILSYSDDNGANWHYNFPNYFGDSTNGKGDTYETAFIDPVIVEGKDGTIYLMVDLFSGGVAINTAPMRPPAATGYVEIDGTQRLVLYTSPDTNLQSDTNYYCYIGDFDQTGYAPVMEPINGSADIFNGYYVDRHYYLYYTSGQFSSKTPDDDKIWCERKGESGVYVQQNVFFYNAILHARNAAYLWIVKSTDGGETWSDPQIVNDQVRTEIGRAHV